MRRRDFFQATLGAVAFLPAARLLGNDLSAPASPARSLSGEPLVLTGRDVADFAASLRGEVLLAGQDGYDRARRLWNAMFDKRPALIARCACPSDVMRSVAFAREHGLLTAVRAGGHSLSGKSTCDGGIMIDLSPMQAVRVDPGAQLAHVEGGALLGHLDRETRMFDLATTAGTVSHTGAAGLTLGGGIGRLGRRFGLACDNLRSLDVVTADARLLRASEAENPDLFWALRGGGGNFGVVTSFEYQLHPMHPTILGGLIGWPLAQAREVLRFYAEYSASAPDELNLDMLLMRTPDGPLIALEACWSAQHGAGERVLAPLRAFGRPLFDHIGPMPYVALQASADEVNAPGQRSYAKSAFFSSLSTETTDALLEAFDSTGPDGPMLHVQQGGGAIGRRPVASSAFPNRDGNYWLIAVSQWTDEAQDQERIARVRAAWKLIAPYTGAAFYVNAASGEERQRGIAENYGINYPRLQQIKRKYDPGNQFRLNANILPA